MENAQKAVLKWMAEDNTGAFLFRGRWVWPQTIRDDAKLAEEICGYFWLYRYA